MEIFEIHITGDEKILNIGNELGLKTITIDLLKPNRSYHRTEYMTSQVHHAENYFECKAYVDDIVDKLVDKGVEIKRVKIECPYYKHYDYQSLYLELHYRAGCNTYPLSHTRGKDEDTYLCTVRTYDKGEYTTLLWNHTRGVVSKRDLVIELCLYDTDVNEDKDWFDLYEQGIRKEVDGCIS